MPHTRALDAVHSVTICSDRRRDGSWEASAEIFATTTCRNIGIDVVGYGSTMIEAEARALALAKARLRRAAT